MTGAAGADGRGREGLGRTPLATNARLDKFLDAQTPTRTAQYPKPKTDTRRTAGGLGNDNGPAASQMSTAAASQAIQADQLYKPKLRAAAGGGVKNSRVLVDSKEKIIDNKALWQKSHLRRVENFPSQRPCGLTKKLTAQLNQPSGASSVPAHNHTPLNQLRQVSATPLSIATLPTDSRQAKYINFVKGASTNKGESPARNLLKQFQANQVEQNQGSLRVEVRVTGPSIGRAGNQGNGIRKEAQGQPGGRQSPPLSLLPQMAPSQTSKLFDEFLANLPPRHLDKVNIDDSQQLGQLQIQYQCFQMEEQLRRLQSEHDQGETIDHFAGGQRQKQEDSSRPGCLGFPSRTRQSLCGLEKYATLDASQRYALYREQLVGQESGTAQNEATAQALRQQKLALTRLAYEYALKLNQLNEAVESGRDGVFQDQHAKQKKEVKRKFKLMIEKAKQIQKTNERLQGMQTIMQSDGEGEGGHGTCNRTSCLPGISREGGDPRRRGAFGVDGSQIIQETKGIEKKNSMLSSDSLINFEDNGQKGITTDYGQKAGTYNKDACLSFDEFWNLSGKDQYQLISQVHSKCRDSNMATLPDRLSSNSKILDYFPKKLQATSQSKEGIEKSTDLQAENLLIVNTIKNSKNNNRANECINHDKATAATSSNSRREPGTGKYKRLKMPPCSGQKHNEDDFNNSEERYHKSDIHNEELPTERDYELLRENFKKLKEETKPSHQRAYSKNANYSINDENDRNCKFQHQYIPKIEKLREIKGMNQGQGFDTAEGADRKLRGDQIHSKDFLPPTKHRQQSQHCPNKHDKQNGLPGRVYHLNGNRLKLAEQQPTNRNKNNLELKSNFRKSDNKKHASVEGDTRESHQIQLNLAKLQPGESPEEKNTTYYYETCRNPEEVLKHNIWRTGQIQGENYHETRSPQVIRRNTSFDTGESVEDDYMETPFKGQKVPYRNSNGVTPSRTKRANDKAPVPLIERNFKRIQMQQSDEDKQCAGDFEERINLERFQDLKSSQRSGEDSQGGGAGKMVNITFRSNFRNTAERTMGGGFGGYGNTGGGPRNAVAQSKAVVRGNGQNPGSIGFGSGECRSWFGQKYNYKDKYQDIDSFLNDFNKQFPPGRFLTDFEEGVVMAGNTDMDHPSSIFGANDAIKTLNVTKMNLSKHQPSRYEENKAQFEAILRQTLQSHIHQKEKKSRRRRRRAARDSKDSKRSSLYIELGQNQKYDDDEVQSDMRDEMDGDQSSQHESFIHLVTVDGPDPNADSTVKQQDDSKKKNQQHSENRNVTIEQKKVPKYFPPKKLPNPFEDAQIEHEKFLQARREAMAKYSEISKNRYKVDESQPLKYVIRSGNNSNLINRVFEESGRTQAVHDPRDPDSILFPGWEPADDQLDSLYNFKWKPTSSGIKYEMISKHGLKQLVNHVRGHHEITTKDRLFFNLKAHYEAQKLQSIYEIVPLTIVLDYMNDNVGEQVQHFLQIHKIIDKVCSLNLPSLGRDVEVINERIQKFQSENQKNLKTRIKISECCHKRQNLWLLKPTGFNQGIGIHIFQDFDQLCEVMASTYGIGRGGGKDKVSIFQPHKQNMPAVLDSAQNRDKFQSQTFVIQKLIERPLLFNNRKFDIRVWVLISSQDNKCYLYKEGYIRTSSKVYEDYDPSISNAEQIHMQLTNNAIQRQTAEYGKYEEGNILSFGELFDYISALPQARDRGVESLFDHFKASMIQIIQNTIKSVKGRLGQQQYTFELLGFDFLLDEQLSTMLIEVNTNPCLEESCELLRRLLPRMLDDLLNVVSDPLFNNAHLGNNGASSFAQYSPPSSFTSTQNTQPVPGRARTNNQNQHRSIYPLPGHLFGVSHPGYADTENLWEHICYYE